MQKPIAIVILSIAVFGSFSMQRQESKPPILDDVSHESLPVRDREAGNGRAETGNTSSQSQRIVPTAEANQKIGVTYTSFKDSKSTPSLMSREERAGEITVDEQGKAHPIRTYKTAAIPNDPYASQWWTAPTGIEASWNLGAGSEQSLLAVIDTGFGLNHEEFNGRLYSNTGETGAAIAENLSMMNCTDSGVALDEACNVIDDNFDGIVDNESGPTLYENTSLLNCTDQSLSLDKSCNLIDDDDNGMIDDAHGFDFVNFDRSAQAGETNPDGTGTTHGTAVMGVAAATGNNARGTAGADWFSKLLPLQALDDDDYGNTLTVGRAIRYAADQGADVISISLGTVDSDEFVRRAVAYAISKGSIVVSASGNDGCECMLYPAAYEEVVAVGASNASDNPASFSSYGSTLDVLAPGVDMTSTYWTKNNTTSAYAGGLNGTSFATPLVAGLLSVMKSHQPDASPHQLIGVLTEQTDRLMLASDQNRSKSQGYGRVDAAQMAGRLLFAKTPTIRYGFTVISEGALHDDYEPTGRATAYQCESDRLGTTTVYRVTNGQQTFFTLSHVERYGALQDGYTSTILSKTMCIDLPSDKPEQLRNLSLLREFENNTNYKY